MTKRFLALCLVPMLLLACSFTVNLPKVVKGSGVSASETRTLALFTAIKLDGSYKVEVNFGATQSVTVETDEKILPFVKTEVQGNTLVVSIEDGISVDFRTDVKVILVMTSLEAVRVAGSSEVTIEGLKADLVKFEVPSSGAITAQGSVDTLQATVEGAGNILCDELQARSVAARVNGSGKISIYVTGDLKAKVNGSGRVIYRGQPSQVQADVNGSGSITPAP